MTQAFFSSAGEHLLVELERVDLLVRAQVERARKGGDGALQGLYISEREVDELLEPSSRMPGWAISPLTEYTRSALDNLREEIRERCAGSAERGISLPLPALAHKFELTELETDALLIALAPEMDLRYERLYAYLQDDVTRKRPSVDLVLNLLCDSMEKKLDARAIFEGASRLVARGLVRLVEDAGYAHPPLLAKSVKVEDGIVRYLSGGLGMDERLSGFARLMTARADLGDLLLPPEVLPGLARFRGARGVLTFSGPHGSGKSTAAEGLARRLGKMLLAVDAERLLESGSFEENLRLLLRDARLHDAVLLLERCDAFMSDTRRVQRSFVERALAQWGGVAVLEAGQPWSAEGDAFTAVAFPAPDFETRLSIWRRVTNLAEAVLEPLAGQFSFTGGQIQAAAKSAVRAAEWRGEGDKEISAADLVAACRTHSSHKLGELATRISPRHSWNDIVLPANKLSQLRELCDAVKQRARVLNTWGFGKKLQGRGINTLFAGPPGTGKTMAAEVIASELGLELYKIDLSMVVSKYIGETEKSLARIFLEAESSNAILFFDEADALFGKRTEVQDAHDRYANIETNYLLQKMEEHDGLAILATNFVKNMDDAFMRRVHGTVEFPVPGAADRLRIWQTVWPLETPLHSDLDLEFLAKQFEVSGGNIRNIALAAAFLASADGMSVGMTHLMRATRREYQKMRTVMAAADFGEYAEQTRG